MHYHCHPHHLQESIHNNVRRCCTFHRHYPRNATTGSLTPSVIAVSVKLEDGDQNGEAAVANELMDSGESTSQKRRKMTGRYKVRTKKEVKDDTATEHPEAISTEVDKTPMDSQNKDVVEDEEHASTTRDEVAVQFVREDPSESPDDEQSETESFRNS